MFEQQQPVVLTVGEQRVLEIVCLAVGNLPEPADAKRTRRDTRSRAAGVIHR
jgi:hypothetical protein